MSDSHELIKANGAASAITPRPWDGGDTQPIDIVGTVDFAIPCMEVREFSPQIGAATQAKCRGNGVCNEDAYLVDGEHSIYLLADGVGSTQDAASAAELALKGLHETLVPLESGMDPEWTLGRSGALINVSRRVVLTAETLGSDMDTTATALKIFSSHAVFVHAGDSRLYAIEALGKRFGLRQLTTDQNSASLVPDERLRGFIYDSIASVETEHALADRAKAYASLRDTYVERYPVPKQYVNGHSRPGYAEVIGKSLHDFWNQRHEIIGSVVKQTWEIGSYRLNSRTRGFLLLTDFVSNALSYHQLKDTVAQAVESGIPAVNLTAELLRQANGVRGFRAIPGGDDGTVIAIFA